jgi:hypothetical protein
MVDIYFENGKSRTKKFIVIDKDVVTGDKEAKLMNEAA